jgi:hypothetical protein
MGEIVHFIGKNELSAQENLDSFIAHAKENFPFTNVSWEDNSWDISTFIIGRALQISTRRIWQQINRSSSI